jgi:hypothetical protein
MKVIKTFNNENKTADIMLNDNIFSIVFYKDGASVGEIVYPNKSAVYVEDAAENWTIGVMTEETILRYIET